MLLALLVDSQSLSVVPVAACCRAVVPPAESGRRCTHRSRPLLHSIAHRPRPLAPGPWIMKQAWHDLLFARRPLPPAALRPIVRSPPGLDSFDGQCRLGVVPFGMSGVSLAPKPQICRRCGPRILFHLPGYPAAMTPVESKRTSPMVRDAIPGAPSSAAVAAPPPRRGCATGEPRRFFGLCVTACARSVGVACMARTFTTCRGRSKTPRSGSKPIRLQPPLNWRCRTRLPPLRFARRPDVLIWPPRHADREASRV